MSLGQVREYDISSGMLSHETSRESIDVENMSEPDVNPRTCLRWRERERKREREREEERERQRDREIARERERDRERQRQRKREMPDVNPRKCT